VTSRNTNSLRGLTLMISRCLLILIFYSNQEVHLLFIFFHIQMLSSKTSWIRWEKWGEAAKDDS